MPKWKEAKNVFPREDNPEMGDLVVRGRDARQEYWWDKPVKLEDEASESPLFKHFIAKEKKSTKR